MAGERFAPFRRRGWDVLPTRKVGVPAAVVMAGIFLGCMSISIGGNHSDSPGKPFEQEGAVEVPGGAELDVYYPIPYAYTPNLKVTSDFGHCLVVEQKEDHFRLKNKSPFRATASWEASGLKGPPPAPVAVPPAGPPAPPPDPAPPLPPAPVPITSSSSK